MPKVHTLASHVCGHHGGRKSTSRFSRVCVTHILPGGCKNNFACISVLPLLELLLSVFLFLVFAALIIMAIEAPYEMEQNKEYIDFMNELRTTTNISTHHFNKLATVYIGKDPVAGSNHFTFGSTFYFCFTIVTTVGYGDFSVQTPGGKIIALILTFVGVPLLIITYTMFTHKMFVVIMHSVLSRSGEVKAAFAKFDTSEDGDGELDVQELQQAFAALNLNLGVEEIELFIQEKDEDCSGTLNVREFTELLHRYHIDVGGLARSHFKGRFAVCGLVLWVVLFVLYFCLIDGLSFLDGLWFVVITLTTVGLGDIVPTDASRHVSMIFMFIGLGLMAMNIDAATSMGMEMAENKRKMEEKKRQDEVTQSIRKLREQRALDKIAHEVAMVQKEEEIVARKRSYNFAHAKEKEKREKIRRKQLKMLQGIQNDFEQESDSSSDEEGDERERHLQKNDCVPRVDIEQWEQDISAQIEIMKEQLLNSTSKRGVSNLYKLFRGVFVNEKLAGLQILKLPQDVEKEEEFEKYLKCFCMQVAIDDAMTGIEKVGHQAKMTAQKRLKPSTVDSRVKKASLVFGAMRAMMASSRLPFSPVHRMKSSDLDNLDEVEVSPSDSEAYLSSDDSDGPPLPPRALNLPPPAPMSNEGGVSFVYESTDESDLDMAEMSKYADQNMDAGDDKIIDVQV